MFNELIELMVSTIITVVRYDHALNPHIPSKITASQIEKMFDILGEAKDGWEGAKWTFNNCSGWGGGDGSAWSACVELNDGTELNFNHGGSEHDFTQIWITKGDCDERAMICA